MNLCDCADGHTCLVHELERERDEARAEVERLRAEAARYCPHYPDCCARADALEGALREVTRLLDLYIAAPAWWAEADDALEAARDALAKHGRGEPYCDESAHPRSPYYRAPKSDAPAQAPACEHERLDPTLTCSRCGHPAPTPVPRCTCPIPTPWVRKPDEHAPDCPARRGAP